MTKPSFHKCRAALGQPKQYHQGGEDAFQSHLEQKRKGTDFEGRHLQEEAAQRTGLLLVAWGRAALLRPPQNNLRSLPGVLKPKRPSLLLPSPLNNRFILLSFWESSFLLQHEEHKDISFL